jgi:hypothetical protein
VWDPSYIAAMDRKELIFKWIKHHFAHQVYWFFTDLREELLYHSIVVRMGAKLNAEARRTMEDR